MEAGSAVYMWPPVTVAMRVSKSASAPSPKAMGKILMPSASTLAAIGLGIGRQTGHEHLVFGGYANRFFTIGQQHDAVEPAFAVLSILCLQGFGQ